MVLTALSNVIKVENAIPINLNKQGKRQIQRSGMSMG